MKQGLTVRIAYKTGILAPNPVRVLHGRGCIFCITVACIFLLAGGCSNLNLGSGQPGSSCQESLDCDDGNPCTRDECQNNRCLSLPNIDALCAPLDGCQIGVCDSEASCVSKAAEGEDCDDGDPCTDDDRCDLSGYCVGRVGTSIGNACEDADPCTTETTCDASGQCQGGIPAADGASCANQDPCTTGNICLPDGSCSQGNPRELAVSTCEICSCDGLWGVSCEKPKVVECPCNLWGDVQFVDSFPDLKIRYVESFADLEIRLTENVPNGPGQWREVTSFPDFTVQIVDSFPDIDIRISDSPDNPCED